MDAINYSPRGRAMPVGAERDAYLADVRKRARELENDNLDVVKNICWFDPKYTLRKFFTNGMFFAVAKTGKTIVQAGNCHCAYAPLSDEDIAYYAELGRQAVQS